MWQKSQIHQQYLCSLCSTMPLQYVLLMLQAWKERTNVKVYLYCMAKFSIRCLFILSNLWSYGQYLNDIFTCSGQNLMDHSCIWCNACLHLNGFEPYKGWHIKQAINQASKQEDRFQCWPHIVGLTKSRTPIDKIYIHYTYELLTH